MATQAAQRCVREAAVAEQEAARKYLARGRDGSKQRRPPRRRGQHFHAEGGRPTARSDDLNFWRRGCAGGSGPGRRRRAGDHCLRCWAASSPTRRGAIPSATAMRSTPPLPALLASAADRDWHAAPSAGQCARPRRTEDANAERLGHRAEFCAESSRNTEPSLSLGVCPIRCSFSVEFSE